MTMPAPSYPRSIHSIPERQLHAGVEACHAVAYRSLITGFSWMRAVGAKAGFVVDAYNDVESVAGLQVDSFEITDGCP